MPTIKPVDGIPDKRLLTKADIETILGITSIGNHVKHDIMQAFADTIEECISTIRAIDPSNELIERLEF